MMLTSAVHLAPFSRAPQNLIRILKFQVCNSKHIENDDNKDRGKKNISAGHRTFPDYILFSLIRMKTFFHSKIFKSCS